MMGKERGVGVGVGFGRKLLRPNLKYCRGKYIKKQGKLTCSRVILAKLTIPPLVRKFPAFYQTQKFITVFTRALHMSILSQTNTVNALSSCFLTFISIYFSHLRLSFLSGFFPLGFPTKTMHAFLFSLKSITKTKNRTWKILDADRGAEILNPDLPHLCKCHSLDLTLCIAGTDIKAYSHLIPSDIRICEIAHNECISNRNKYI